MVGRFVASQFIKPLQIPLENTSQMGSVKGEAQDTEPELGFTECFMEMA